LSGKNKKYDGFVLIELVVSLTIFGILLICVAISLDGFRRFNHYQLTRQRCVAAAQAQLDSIAVTGKSVGDEDFSRLWLGLTVSIEKSDGTGQWAGTKLAKVKVKAKSFYKNVEVELCRYILTKAEN
jgi:prepilin-type N-terminal cleavage/methylation domain-containing protein